MRKRRMLCLLFALALALSLLAGCGAAPETAQSQGGDTAADDGHYPVTVTNYDREVTVESKPESVLTLGPNCTELFVALGLGDLVVGRSLVNHSRGPLDEYADEVNAIPELNHSSATRERILSSGADFIYTLDWEIGEEGVVIDEVEEYGMNVYVNAAKTLEDQYKEIEDIGKIFNVEDAAAKFIQEQKDRISAVQDKVKGEEPVKVLIYDSGNDGVFTCSGTNFETLLVTFLMISPNVIGSPSATKKYWLANRTSSSSTIMIHPQWKRRSRRLLPNRFFASLTVSKISALQPLSWKAFFPATVWPIPWNGWPRTFSRISSNEILE